MITISGGFANFLLKVSIFFKTNVYDLLLLPSALDALD
jgi:hypothetical protein